MGQRTSKEVIVIDKITSFLINELEMRYKGHSGNEDLFYCPHCGEDKEPKLNINLDLKVFRCWRCQEHGHLSQLPKFLEMEADETKEFHKLLGYTRDKRKVEKKFNFNEDDFKHISEVKGKAYALVDEFVEQKKISFDTLSQSTTYFHRKKNSSNRIVFFREKNGVRTGARLRKTDQRASTPKVYQIEGSCNNFFNYDEALTMLTFSDNRVLYILEGETDCLTMKEIGINNVVALPNGCGNYKWVLENKELLELANEIVVIYDDDQAGQDAKNGLVYRVDFPQKLKEVSLKSLKEDEELEGDDVNSIWQDIVKKFDWGEEAKSYYRELIRKYTKDLEIESLQSGYEEDTEVEIIGTDYKPFDIMLEGLRVGEVTVLTGSASQGKTLATTCLVSRNVEHKIHSTIFSGEMQKGVIFSGIVNTMASIDNCNVTVNSYGRKIYKAKPEIRRILSKEIDNYTRFIDNKLRDIDEIISLIKLSVVKYDSRVIILDNLMTLNTEKEKTSNEKQLYIADRLKQVAEQLNIHIVLVAHLRKVNGMCPFDITFDEISGASEVAKMVDNVLLIFRTNPSKIPDKYSDMCEQYDTDTFIRNLKCRVVGELIGKALPLKFVPEIRGLILCDKQDTLDGKLISEFDRRSRILKERSSDDRPRTVKEDIAKRKQDKYEVRARDKHSNTGKESGDKTEHVHRKDVHTGQKKSKVKRTNKRRNKVNKRE